MLQRKRAKMTNHCRLVQRLMGINKESTTMDKGRIFDMISSQCSTQNWRIRQENSLSTKFWEIGAYKLYTYCVGVCYYMSTKGIQTCSWKNQEDSLLKVNIRTLYMRKNFISIAKIFKIIMEIKNCWGFRVLSFIFSPLMYI